MRTVPFFAVIAGPVLAWNVQQWLGATGPIRSRRGRVLAFAGALGLLVCAWPGWLQVPPFEPRRWAIETSLSLERGAAATHRWHQEGKLGADAGGLYLSADTAAAFAWFCPEEKLVRDDGLAAVILGEREVPPDWMDQMRAAGINHVIVHAPDGSGLLAALQALLADPLHWPLLYLEGDLAVFGWRDPDQGPDGGAGAFRASNWTSNISPSIPPRTGGLRTEGPRMTPSPGAGGMPCGKLLLHVPWTVMKRPSIASTPRRCCAWRTTGMPKPGRSIRPPACSSPRPVG